MVSYYKNTAKVSVGNASLHFNRYMTPARRENKAKGHFCSDRLTEQVNSSLNRPTNMFSKLQFLFWGHTGMT